MPRIDLPRLPDDSRVWIFGITPALDEGQQPRFLAEVDRFLDGWAAHGEPIASARDLREGVFLIVAAGRDAETSGCSIDRMFGTLQTLERELAVSVLDGSRVFVRHGDGRPEGMSRSEFREKADPHTIVFDTTAATLGQIRSGAWERRAADSWHRDLLRRVV